ncbi:hypothetical protein [Salmonirosea aquatica]|uniref:Lipoprotein n=1 Tax=Salmonirosea aquatica TaxID=2654236 RepID=A0A7C9BHK1_9BACT|nr:hypothetical protein [Cytophagaceae bacterium SJW1-29]
MKKLLFLSLLALYACDKPFCNEKPNDEIAGIVIKVIGDQTYSAYDPERGEDLARFGIHITTDAQYRRVFAHCCAARLDSLDFTQYDLLGLTTVNKGQHSTYLRNVQRDESAKKVTYTVTERYCKRSSPVEGQGNFVLVPKVPSGYSVEYVRK